MFTDQVWWCNIKQFLNYSKANLCKPIGDIINYSSFICPFELGKEGEKNTNFGYLENVKRFLDEIKSIFHKFFEGLSSGTKYFA